PVRRGGPVELVLHDAGLHTGGARLRVELDDRAHVPREVEDDRLPDGLPGEARARAAGQHGHAVLTRDADRGDHVTRVPRGDHADGRDRVHARVPGVQVARVVVEEDLALELAVERPSKLTHSAASRRCSTAASTPPGLIGTPASCNPICTPPRVPMSVRSLKWPRWPIRKTFPASLPSPAPSDMSNFSRMTRRTS